MSRNTLVKQNQSAIASRDHRAEAIAFLEQLIIEKNNFSEEKHRYHVETAKMVYDETLQYTTEKAGRIPTLNEILSKMYEFNYKILWELSTYDLLNGLGEYGYSDQLSPDERYFLSENDCIEEIFEHWENYLSMELCFNPQEYLGELLCESNLSYYDDMNLQYRLLTLYDHAVCVNDCQNLLLPSWHYQSAARGSVAEDADYIMRLRFLSEEIKEINYEEENDNE
ncbi:MAG: hypothetical protein K0R00_108 [Herbinix sp.]|jgi:hypothetical protein|nr:hypothetical protein [Herbinix sp.]